MWTDPLTKFGGWKLPVASFTQVCHASGLAILTWPSGRTTTEMYAGNALYTELDRACGVTKEQKEQNLINSLKFYRGITSVNGWWIRSKRGRKKARRILLCVWMSPDDYAKFVTSGGRHADPAH